MGAAVMFLVRGWAGYYPSKVSTMGAEYPSLEVLQETAESGRETLEALVALHLQHEEFAEQMAGDVDALRDRVEMLADAQSPTPTGT
jgi:hypothetical protein